MEYFDTHAHYNDKAYEGILDEVLDECKKNNIKKIVNIGYNKESSIKAIELSNKYENMYAVIGVHPSDVDVNNAEDIYDVYNEYNNGKIVAIGEIGLDYSYVKDNKEKQFELFISQIELANELKLPVAIHTRDASLDTYNILKEHKPKYGGLLHCFKPTDDLMKLVLDEGYYVGLGGNITYKRSKSFPNYLKQIPLSNIVLETDCPYLAPVPYKGELNKSSYIPIICKKLAEYLEIDEEEIANKVYENSYNIYNIKK